MSYTTKKTRKVMGSSNGNGNGNGNAKSAKHHHQEEQEQDEEDENTWECTVCTFRNQDQAFKCEICDTRKGTSTRKPRLNPSVVQQQTLVQTLAVQQVVAGEKAALRKLRNSECRSPESSASMDAMDSPHNNTIHYTNSNSNSKVDARLLKRRPVPVLFPDSLVVRSSIKKWPITVNGVTFTLTEFKGRTSPRGRKKAT